MRESVTYRAILEEGEAIGLEKGLEKGLQKGLAEGQALGRLNAERTMLLRLASRRLGQPDEATRRRIEDLADPKTLEAMLDRVLDAADWAELVAGLV